MSIGVQTAGATSALQAILPEGTSVYVGLFEDEDATVECTALGYARVAYTGWSLAGDPLTRSNTGDIEFAGFAEDTHVGAVGWWSAAVGGDLIFTSLLTGMASGVDVVAGDIVRFPAGTFSVSAS